MPIDFFDPRYQKEPARTECKFGITDPGEDKAACTTTGNAVKWVAIVTNQTGTPLFFIPVDKNIPLAGKRCDGMFYFAQSQSTIVFVELKTGKTRQKSQWIKNGIEQLKATIMCFNTSTSSTQCTEKRAYISNARHPLSREFSLGRKERFKSETGFYLKITQYITFV